MFLRCLGGNGGLLFPWRIIVLALNLARPRPAAPPGSPTRPARGMSGFWIRQVHARHVWEPTQEQTLPTTNNSLTVHQHFGTGTKSGLRSCPLTSIPKPFCLFEPFSCKACLGNTLCFRVDLLNPKPRHTTGGSGRSAQRSGRERSGKIVCQQNYSSSKQMSSVPTKAPNKHRLNDSPEARTCEILCKPTEEHGNRLTRGLSAVYNRDEKRSLFLAADQWNDDFLSL